MPAEDNFPPGFFHPKKSVTTPEIIHLPDPYLPEQDLQKRLDAGTLDVSELDTSGGSLKIPAGETLYRNRFYVCAFGGLEKPDDTPVYLSGGGCEVWRVLYVGYLVEELMWMRRSTRGQILLDRKRKQIFAIWKYVRVCPFKRATVLDVWDKENGEYRPDADTYAGEGPGTQWIDEEASGRPTPWNGTVPGPPHEAEHLITDPDLPQTGWEPQISVPPTGRPEQPGAVREPGFVMPPAQGWMQSAKSTDADGNIIEHRRYSKLRLPARMGESPCIEEATYEIWEDTYLHKPNGESSRLSSKPVEPPLTETVKIRIPGCRE